MHFVIMFDAVNFSTLSQFFLTIFIVDSVCNAKKGLSGEGVVVRPVFPLPNNGSSHTFNISKLLLWLYCNSSVLLDCISFYSDLFSYLLFAYNGNTENDHSDSFHKPKRSKLTSSLRTILGCNNPSCVQYLH